MLNASYIVGLTDGEGCFLVCLRKDYRIDLRFFITQASDNKTLLDKVRDYFGVGTVYQKRSAQEGRLPSFVYEVSKRDDIYNVVIPFFSKNVLEGGKARSFESFRIIAGIVKGKQDTRKLTSKELDYIWGLKLRMNKHYGSPDAEKPLVGWERTKVSIKCNPSRQKSWGQPNLVCYGRS